MNLAHLHLIINHLPIVGIPVALLFLAHGIWKGNSSSKRFALLIMFLISIVVLPVYLTGEPAEDMVENLPGVTKSLIGAHEEAAEVSLILTLLTGASAIVALVLQRDERKGKISSYATLSVAVVALLSLMYTGNLGGKIRHTEIRDGAASASTEKSPGKHDE